MNPDCDVFVCYHSSDRDAAMHIATRLRGHQLAVWIDETRLDAGSAYMQEIEQAIQKAQAAIVLLGPDGFGRWQELEIGACIQEWVGRRMPVVPVVLPHTHSITLPRFLSGFSIVDFRSGLSDERAWSKLVSTISHAVGRDALSALVEEEIQATAAEDGSPIDAWGMAAVKSRLHAAASVLAAEAANEANSAADSITDGALRLVPVIVGLRWNRGYMSAVEQLLNVTAPSGYVGDYPCEATVPEGTTTDGVLSATADVDGAVTIALDDVPAVRVHVTAQDIQDVILDSVNGYGRLGAPQEGGLSLLDRIREIPLARTHLPTRLERALFENREVLPALIARLRIPGAEWIMPDSAEHPAIGLSVTGGASPMEVLPSTDDRADVVTFAARRAFRPEGRSRVSRDDLRNLLSLESVRKLFGSRIEEDPEGVLDELQHLIRPAE